MSPLIIFYPLAVASLVGSLGVVLSRNVVHAALYLLLALVSTAGIFFLLYAEFIALVQLLIYGGAVVIVIFFALMLTKARGTPVSLDHPQWPLAVVVSLATFGVLAALLWKVAPGTTPAQNPSLADLGQSIFSTWLIPFELVSLVLLVALIGAVILARPGGEGK